MHRKQRAHCEKDGDPHSPRLFGLKKVLLEGAELYRVAARDRDTLEKYAKGTPNDWLENNLYHHPTRSYLGIALLVVADLVLFGVPGIIMIALQLSNMPFMAAGIVNGGVTHEGYRNSRPTTLRRTFGRSASSSRRGAAQQPSRVSDVGALFDAPARGRHGRAALKVLVWLKLAKRDSARGRSSAAREPSRSTSELDELRAIIVQPHARAAATHYKRHCCRAAARELESLGENANSLLRRTRRQLSWHPECCDESSRQRLAELAQRSALQDSSAVS